MVSDEIENQNQEPADLSSADGAPSEDGIKTESEDPSEVLEPVYAQSRRRRVVDNGDDGKPPLWLLTFGDIMALMLTFFVLFYSMAVPEEEKWDQMTTGLTQGVSTQKAPKWNSGGQDSVNIQKLSLNKALDLAYLQGLVQEVMNNNPTLGNVVLIPQRDRLVLSMPSDLLFDAGRADMSVDGEKALFALGGALYRIRNRIEIIGHSDPRPIPDKSAEFSSNWGLSLSRATTVAGVLEVVGYTRPMIVRGLSSARYDELPSSVPEAERLNLSRRVDIVIMKDDGARDLFRVGG